jgi:uncharacterized lipoprotein YehR (DUF1307 family)
MNQYYRSSANNEVEVLSAVVIVMLVLFLLLVIRNWYNLYKKRSFRKKNKKLHEDLNSLEVKLNHQDQQQIVITELKERLSTKNLEIQDLEDDIENYKQKFYETLSEKDREIAGHKESINHQKKAYERYVIFKSVEANNTRLGAHFIKNVISQIYDDLESSEPSYRSFLGIRYQLSKNDKKLPSINALKNIFKLLDYNVAALNKDSISLQEELEHIQMFLDLITYLKPRAKIKLNNTLTKSLKKTLRIKPTLFFPFIENALKHGDLNQDNSFIHIDLKELTDQQLSYCLTNSAYSPRKNELLNEIKSSFGLKALRELIDAYYPGSTLEHNSVENELYKSQLILKLS